jgi:large subunit ribosomal protein L21
MQPESPTKLHALTPVSAARYTLGLSSEAIFWRELTVAYAIIQAGGKQFRVNEGDVVQVPSLTAEVGSSVEFDTLLAADGDQIKVGGSLEGQRVTGTVVEHGRGRKVIVFKKKRRKQYKKTHGHRQNFTAVRIESVGAASDKSE